MTTTSPRHYWPSLDGLRGLAILMVLAHNFQVLDDQPNSVGRAIEIALDAGWVGVQLFFVLSGFLITSILLAAQGSADYYRSFYARRILRIFPLYYGALMVFTVLLPTIGITLHGSEGSLWLWLYLSNWLSPLGFGNGGLPHFWSLAVEEQFYLVWPWLCRRRTASEVLGLCVVVAGLSLAWRLVMLAMHANPESIYEWTPCRMDALALGAAAAAWLAIPAPAGHVRQVPDWLFPAALALALGWLLLQRGYPRTDALAQSVGYSVLAVAFSGIVLAAAGSAGRSQSRLVVRLLSSRAIASVGRFSYAMYVIHKPLHDLVGKPLVATLGLSRSVGVGTALGYFLSASLVTYLVAAFLYFAFERHFLSLKQRFPMPGVH